MTDGPGILSKSAHLTLNKTLRLLVLPGNGLGTLLQAVARLLGNVY